MNEIDAAESDPSLEGVYIKIVDEWGVIWMK